MGQRLTYALLAALTIALGLASRHYSTLLLPWLAKNAGDLLYTTMVYWLLGLVFPGLSAPRKAAGAFGLCVLIECAKLIQTLLAISIRSTVAGRLIFGVGFHWSNIFWYLIGSLLGFGLETAFLRTRRGKE